MPELRHINDNEMRSLLREAYSQDPERSFLERFARSLRDPAIPLDANNRRRLHPLWLTLGLMLMLGICVFLYFSFLRPQP